MRQWMNARCGQIPVNNIASKEPRITSPLRHNAVSISPVGEPTTIASVTPINNPWYGFLPSASQPQRNIAAAHQTNISGNEINSSCRAIRPKIEPNTVPPIRSKARGTTFPQNEIGPIITTMVTSGQVLSGIVNRRIMRKVSRNASATRVPCTMR